IVRTVCTKSLCAPSVQNHSAHRLYKIIVAHHLYKIIVHTVCNKIIAHTVCTKSWCTHFCVCGNARGRDGVHTVSSNVIR
ncbi:MAG: hypothetical protein J6S93_02120, partial [Paludibacteraceae bacterium]|nr:hypothetical protein [Paludibacteraceae bacterium]